MKHLWEPYSRGLFPHKIHTTGFSRMMYKWVCRKSPASYPSYASLFRVLQHKPCMSYTNESGHLWMSRVTYLRAHMADSFVCYFSLRHVAHSRPYMLLQINGSCHLCVYECHIDAMKCVTHITHWQVTWLINVWDSYVTWLIHRCDMNNSCIACLIHVWHESFMCDMTN